jgi:hypothetical protein
MRTSADLPGATWDVFVLKFPLVVYTRKKVVFVGARYKHVGIHNTAASSYIPET